MIDRQSSVAVASAILAFAAAISSATAKERTPADFGGGEKTLAELIEFPELRGDTNVAISCIGLVSAKGKLEQHGCYRRNPGDETFAAAIYAAAKKARLRPAVYDGRPVRVVFQYRVRFVKKGEDQHIDFVANPGYAENVEAYGQEHIAAQRVFGKETWGKACPKQAKFTVLARANVDYDGSPSAVSVTHADGIPVTAKCQQAIIDTILGSRFLPAVADGEAVPSTFVEPFGN